MSDGKIKTCATAGCGWHCCDFKQGNYIVTLPGEVDDKNIDHLEVIDDDYLGGKKLVCKAKDKANCDGGYKPLDCRMYPLFPKADLTYIAGTKCPLSVTTKKAHRQRCFELLRQYMLDNPDKPVLHFLENVELVGYEKL